MKSNYLDLFHGIGGFALGAYWAGMKFDKHYCSDIDKYCQKLYKIRFPESIQLDDIEKFDFNSLPKGNWLITGGFPCQDISIAGQRKGLIDEEGNKTRSGLWFDFARAIRVLQPKIVIIENVPMLLRNGFDRVLSDLAEIGYDAEWQNISAAEMGANHKRERIWIVAHSNSNRSQESSNINIGQKNEKQAGCQVRRTFEKKSAANTNKRFKLFCRKVGRMGREQKHFSWDRNWQITSEPFICRGTNGISGRMDRLKGLGNSIVPQIACLLFNLIKEIYYE